MSFLRTARAVPVGLKCLRGLVVPIVVVLLAASVVSCGGGKKLPAFGSTQNAYATLPNEGSVLLLQINGITGAITTAQQTPQLTGTSPNGLALLSKKFLYVANSGANTIAIFNVASDGTLKLNGTPTPAGGSGPHAVVIDPSGKYLLVTNSFSNNISVFSIDSSSGALSPVGAPVFANDSPTEIVMQASGNFVYVTNPGDGTVTAFTFDSSTGALAFIGAPIFSGKGASGLVIDGSEHFLYVANTSAVNQGSTAIGNISGFMIDSTSGALSALPGSPFTSTLGNGPGALVVDPNNKFVFATTPGGNYSIWCFAIDANNGELTAVIGSPFSVPSGGLFALIDATGSFFYIGSGNGVAAYTYNQNNGQPTVITNSPFSTGSAPGQMVIAN